MTQTVSVLEQDYVPPSRPYSAEELDYIRSELVRKCRLGKHEVYHTRCKHHYKVKENSRKEKELLESGKTEDVGNCSTCWRLGRTPRELKDRAYDMCDEYMYRFSSEPKKLTYDHVDLESTFYKWLYLESTGDDDRRGNRRERGDRRDDPEPQYDS